MTFRTIIATTLACLLLSAGVLAAKAAQVSPNEHFQIDAKGTMVQVFDCWTTPYPQCRFQFEHPDGLKGPIIEGWNEDLAKMRDAFGTPVVNPPVPSPQGSASCQPTIYSGLYDSSTEASDELMRELIRNYFTGVASPGFDVSVDIQSLEHEEPFLNTRGYLDGQGATLITNGAPENAVIYPMRTRLTVCEEESQFSAVQRDHDWELYCFVNEDDQWGCGVSQSFSN